MPESEKRWMIYICPNCGKRKAGAYFCRCVVPSSRCQKIEVVPLSTLEEQREGLRREIARIQDEANGAEELRTLALRDGDAAGAAIHRAEFLAFDTVNRRLEALLQSDREEAGR